MGTRVIIGEYPYEVIDFSVSEDSSPLSAGDSSGGVGQFSMSFATPTTITERIYPLIEDPNNPGFLLEVI